MEVAGPLGTPLGLAQRKRRLDSLEAAQGAFFGISAVALCPPGECSLVRWAQRLRGTGTLVAPAEPAWSLAGRGRLTPALGNTGSGHSPSRVAALSCKSKS